MKKIFKALKMVGEIYLVGVIVNVFLSTVFSLLYFVFKAGAKYITKK